jgi:hypothetical protein
VEPTSDRPTLRDHVAIALVSCAVLLYEIAVTRVLSVVLWYHFAFLVISLAMLGIGLPGAWFAAYPPGRFALRIALVASGLAVPASVAVIFAAGETVTLAQGLPGASLFGQGGMLLVLACVVAPLLCLGSAVCILLIGAKGRAVGRLYAADLLGAAIAAAAIVPLLHAVPTPLVIAAAGLLPLGAAMLYGRVTAMLAFVSAAVLVGTMAWGAPFEVRATKSYVEPKNLVYARWTPTARITIFPDIFYVKDPTKGFGWGMGDRYEPSKPIEQLWIEQDSSAGTPVTKLETTPQALDHLFYDVTSAAYQLRPPERACIIGAGGGRDILTALKAGARDVDAVELNGAIVKALSGPLRDFTGDVYHLPGVHTHIDEGRSFLTRSAGGYDLLQISLIDSWAATAAGAFALSENYLYTTEAIRLYWRRTAPTGIVSISRWMAGDRQLEGARLSKLAVHALSLEGVTDPQRHIAVLQAWSVGTFLLSKTPFDEAALAKLDAVCEERGFVRQWPKSPSSDDTVVAEVLARGTSAYESRGIDLRPPTDDRPFFFQTLSLLHNVDQGTLAGLSNNEHSVALLRLLLGVVSALALVLFFLPFALRRRVEQGAPFWSGSAYFLCIGLAFMFVEMPCVQRFVLYLGHPSYATTVVLATLLLGAGLGSSAAAHAGAAAVRRVLAVLPVLVVALALSSPPLFTATLGWSFPARVALSALLLAPAGFAMGFAFPSGMQAFGQRNGAWFWAVNGAASVLASVFSLAFAIVAGFFATAIVGAAFYAVAYMLIRGELIPKSDRGEGFVDRPVRTETASSVLTPGESKAARSVGAGT